MNALATTMTVPFEEAEAAVRAALQSQGFGVLTEIDVAAIFKAKLGVDRPAIKILGACNPSIAHQALTIDESTALLLPCNVVIESVEDGIRVSIADPRSLLAGAALARVAEEAATRLSAAVVALNGS